jgi:hypothetical protein
MVNLGDTALLLALAKLWNVSSPQRAIALVMMVRSVSVVCTMVVRW